LDDQRYGWLKESTAVAELWAGSNLLITTLLRTFVPAVVVKQEPGEDQMIQWWRRYFAAMERLRQAGIATVVDERHGAEIYTSTRAQWHNRMMALAPALGYIVEEIDCAGGVDSMGAAAPRAPAQGSREVKPFASGDAMVENFRR
jgi:hypothetical protein